MSTYRSVTDAIAASKRRHKPLLILAHDDAETAASLVDLSGVRGLCVVHVVLRGTDDYRLFTEASRISTTPHASIIAPNGRRADVTTSQLEEDMATLFKTCLLAAEWPADDVKAQLAQAEANARFVQPSARVIQEQQEKKAASLLATSGGSSGAATATAASSSSAQQQSPPPASSLGKEVTVTATASSPSVEIAAAAALKTADAAPPSDVVAATSGIAAAAAVAMDGNSDGGVKVRLQLPTEELMFRVAADQLLDVVWTQAEKALSSSSSSGPHRLPGGAPLQLRLVLAPNRELKPSDRNSTFVGLGVTSGAVLIRCSVVTTSPPEAVVATPTFVPPSVPTTTPIVEEREAHHQVADRVVVSPAAPIVIPTSTMARMRLTFPKGGVDPITLESIDLSTTTWRAIAERVSEHLGRPSQAFDMVGPPARRVRHEEYEMTLGAWGIGGGSCAVRVNTFDDQPPQTAQAGDAEPAASAPPQSSRVGSLIGTVSSTVMGWFRRSSSSPAVADGDAAAAATDAPVSHAPTPAAAATPATTFTSMADMRRAAEAEEARRRKEAGDKEFFGGASTNILGKKDDE